MSRLEFGPKPKEMEVTDIKTGHFVFSPVEGGPVSYKSLNKAVSDAGYEIESAVIVVTGTLDAARHLATPNGQIFHLTAVDEAVKRQLVDLEPGARLRVEGAWSVEEGGDIVVVSKMSTAPEGTTSDETPR